MLSINYVQQRVLKLTALLSTSLAWPARLAVAGLNFSRNLAPTFLRNPVLTEFSVILLTSCTADSALPPNLTMAKRESENLSRSDVGAASPAYFIMNS